MSDAYEIREVEEPEAWDGFVRTAHGGTIFATSTWLDCAERATGCRAVRLGCFRGERLIAGVCGVEEHRGPLVRLATPVLTPHGGFLLAPVIAKGPAKLESEWHQAAPLLASHLLRRYPHVRLVQGPGLDDHRPFTWAGWTARVRYTYLLDPTDPEALWERVERRTRTVIRKAERAGFTVRETRDMDLLGRQYRMVYDRGNGPAPVPAATVTRLAALALDAGLAEARTVVSPTGEVASIVVFVRGWDTVHAWVSGADPAFNPTGATSLLYWEYLTRAGLPRFDFVGANLPAVAHFKRGFGGDLVAYHALEGFRHAGVRALVVLGSRLRSSLR
ncbi:MAG: GNAT family N-acetyltransferase [Candidatus Latescibacterota bacterium]